MSVTAKLQQNKTSHHVGAIWFHITWESEHRGVDQHGTVWYNRSRPTCSHPSIPAMCDIAHATLTNKKYFTALREEEVHAELEQEEINFYNRNSGR